MSNEKLMERLKEAGLKQINVEGWDVYCITVEGKVKSYNMLNTFMPDDIQGILRDYPMVLGIAE